MARQNVSLARHSIRHNNIYRYSHSKLCEGCLRDYVGEFLSLSASLFEFDFDLAKFRKLKCAANMCSHCLVVGFFCGCQILKIEMKKKNLVLGKSLNFKLLRKGVTVSIHWNDKSNK